MHSVITISLSLMFAIAARPTQTETLEHNLNETIRTDDWPEPEELWFPPGHPDRNKCGPPAPPLNGYLAICEPANGTSNCCSASGYCGTGEDYCKCDGCLDYSSMNTLKVRPRQPEQIRWHSLNMTAFQMGIPRCGPKSDQVNGDMAICNPDSDAFCCSGHGFCGSGPLYCKCKTCFDSRDIVKPLFPPSESPEYRLEWSDKKPEILHDFGEGVLVTQIMDSYGGPREIKVASEFSHTFDLQASESELGTKLDELLKQTFENLPGNFNLTRRKNTHSTVKATIQMDERSRGAVSFRPRLIKLKGKVRRAYYSSNGVQAKNSSLPSNEFSLTLRSTETDRNGVALGDISVQYFGTDKHLHPKFYTLSSRFAQLNEPLPWNSKDIRSPLQCGELAIEANKSIAFYDLNQMSCAFGKITQPSTYLRWIFEDSVFSLDNQGQLVGNYTIKPESAARSLDRTDDRSRVAKWIDEEKCDLISHANRIDTCLRFHDRPGSILMFLREQQT